ncbi:MAG: ISAs1 family transposase, partial [Treponema sp.]|nr:ISAs1 family transposase [Treponema sp.]
MDIRTELALIPDPRIDRCKKHNLVDILLLCIIAMVCGVESVEDMVFFGETHQGWLKKYLGLPNGIPSADTILRVLGRIDHRKFEACFLSWTRGYFRERAGAGSVIAIDGKTVRGSESGERKAIHIVSAWADEMGLVLGQVQTEEKSNEITAIPALLGALDISGCIVTIDAMGCQKAIAADIVAKHGGYTLALKENHPEVYAEAREL